MLLLRCSQTNQWDSFNFRADRIEDAHWNLRKTVKMSTRAVQSKPTKLEDLERMNGVQHHVTEVQSGETSNGKDLSHLVTFQKGNFVKDWRPPEDRFYHTIIWSVQLCFRFMTCFTVGKTCR